MNQEHKDKISLGLKRAYLNGSRTKTMLGKKQSAETILKKIQSRSWYRHSEETKKKIGQSNSISLKGMKRSRETIEKMRASKKKAVLDGRCNFYIDGRSYNPIYKSWLKNKRNRSKRSNGGEHSFKEWQELKIKYNFTCPACKKSEPEIKLTEDHIEPISRGGDDYIINIQPLCQGCNSKKSNKIICYANSSRFRN